MSVIRHGCILPKQSEQGAKHDRLTVFGANRHGLDCPAQPSDYWELRGSVFHYFGGNQRIGVDMNNDEDDDMIFSLAFAAVTILTVLFVVGSVGAIIWSWL